MRIILTYRICLLALGATVVFLSSGPVGAAPTCIGQYPGAICTDDQTHPMFVWMVNLDAWTDFVFRTKNLEQLPAESNVPDTAMWLLDATSGEIIAIDDDGGATRTDPFASAISYSTTRSMKTVYVVVAAQNANAYGLTDVEILGNGSPWGGVYDVRFGGWRTVRELKLNDLLFAGVMPGFGDLLHTNRILALSNSALDCDTNCGYYAIDTGSRAGLSRVWVPFTSGVSSVWVGSGLPDDVVATRFFHSRLSPWWSGYEYDDLDGDMLTYEVEELLDTCDNAFGPSTDCSDTTGYRFGARQDDYPISFNGSDTDNDGLLDLWEVFAVAHCCSDTPSPPYNDPGECDDRTVDGGSLSGNCYALPLSGMNEPDPREYDFYLESDSSTNAGSPFLWLGALDHFLWTYSEEGLECNDNFSDETANCPDALDADWIDAHYQVVMHVYNDGLIQPEKEHREVLLAVANANYNTDHFTPERKYNPVFTYNLQTPDGTGRGGVHSRISAVGINGIDRGTATAHEIGHNLGLRHWGDGTDDGNYKQNYPSLMNYGYSYRMTQKTQDVGGQWFELWPSDIGHNCGSDDECATRECSGGVCSMDTAHGFGARFSRGRCLPVDLSETDLDEFDADMGLTAQLIAYEERADGPDLDFEPICFLGVCFIDWNGDGDYSVNPVSQDLNSDLDETDRFSDHNDWFAIYKDGHRRLTDNPDYFQPDFLAYGSNFSDSAADYTGYHTTVGFDGVLNWPAGYAPYGDAAEFRGSGTSDHIRLDSDDNLDSMGIGKDGGINGQGFRADILFELDAFPGGVGSYMVLMQSNIFYMRVRREASGTYMEGLLNTGQTWVSTTVYALPLQTGTWYWAILVWDDGAGELTAYVVPADPLQAENPPVGNDDWNETAGRCSRLTGQTMSTAVSTNDVFIGGTGYSATTFDGLLDEPLLFNYAPTFFRSGVTCP